MGRLWNKWLVPALFAVILFLCIRVANDIPKHEYYWESNEWNFMLKDMLVVLFMSYPIFFLLKYWLRLCRKRKLVWWQEYGVVVLTVFHFLPLLRPTIIIINTDSGQIHLPKRNR